ncbi:MAG TPA: metalloregulator ArsR/SmtB family transcription factor [Gammaproteobacteria bacterium]|nr:metalloregulator ArsR/SmtB family transcription factor [Gammaproteobacteria bacterium]
MASKGKPNIDISENLDIIIAMEQVEVFKALANESRLKILKWMKEPDKHFGDCPTGGVRGRRVCVGEIQAKLGLSQSTASQYLAILEQAGLVTARREGQWTFYERNEAALQEVGRFLNQEL